MYRYIEKSQSLGVGGGGGGGGREGGGWGDGGERGRGVVLCTVVYSECKLIPKPREKGS